MNITKILFELQDKKFRDFNSRLIPNIDKESVIGIKTPELKSIAKELIKEGSADNFISVLPHKYFEENQIHAFVISSIKDYDKCIYELERFLPYIDNWATCDQLIPKVLGKYPEKTLKKADVYLKSKHTYTVRFGIGIYMRYFLDESFDKKYLEKIAKIRNEDYYVRTMISWYFATALAKQYESTITVFTEKKLDTWVHNKAIQKAGESFRVTEEHKQNLKKLIIR